jgi:glycosyltransferase involved in cell wall biosynthesis
LKVRVLRIIARMNVGGPAYHVSLLSGRLDPSRYETLLVAGAVGPGEASFEELAERCGAEMHHVPALGPALHPVRDTAALLALIREARRFCPHIVHTHTAKAGLLGRIAALAVTPRPVIVHTYHGHVLSGYFGPVRTAVFRGIERLLARVSDCLIGVSQVTVDELVVQRVGPRHRFRVVRLGLELDRFLRLERADGDAFRQELGLAAGDVLAVFVGRLVPIKRVDMLLEAVARARLDGARMRLAVVGDGALRSALERQAAELGLSGAVSFLGYRRDLDRIAGATDIAVLSSRNEGTPVALIEAAAAGRPAVATDVGGVGDVVTPSTGRLVPSGDVDAFAAALVELSGDRTAREEMGAAAREHVGRTFTVEQLLANVDCLYAELLRDRQP